MRMPLGLHDPVPGAIPLRFGTYLNHRELPDPPETFGHMDLVSDWGMLGNNAYGDCAVAGPLHQIMLNCSESGTPVSFSTDTALQNYSDITGFTEVDPDTGQPYPDGANPTDNGTAIDVMAQYWMDTGLVDDDGNRHQIVAVVDLNPGDLRELWVAMYLFQSVGLGFALPSTAQEQTQRGEPWDVVRGAYIEGGHYVPAFNKLGSHMNAGVSWGQPQFFTTRFFREYNNQGIVVLDEEMMVNARSVDGFDDQQLRDDIAELQKEQV